MAAASARTKWVAWAAATRPVWNYRSVQQCKNRYYAVIWNIICGAPSTRSLPYLLSPAPGTASLSHRPQAIRPSSPKSNPGTFTLAAAAKHASGRGRVIEFRSRMQGAPASSSSGVWRRPRRGSSGCRRLWPHDRCGTTGRGVQQRKNRYYAMIWNIICEIYE